MTRMRASIPIQHYRYSARLGDDLYERLDRQRHTTEAQAHSEGARRAKKMLAKGKIGT